MSQPGFPNKWYLELEGKRMGPFAPEQILGLLADGEIPEDLKVSPDPALAEKSGFSGAPAGSGVGSMTASALREVYFMESGSPSSQTALVEPQSTQQSVSAENEADQELATARRLFDLFQTA